MSPADAVREALAANVGTISGVPDDLEWDDVGLLCQDLMRASTRRSHPEMADALDAGDFRRAAALHLERLEARR